MIALFHGRRKDSTSIALKLKFEYGNPLLVTFSPLILNECGQHNKALIDLGFDAILLDQITRLQKHYRKIFVEKEILKLHGMQG